MWGSCERAWLGVTSGPIEHEDQTPGCPRCGESVGELGVGADGSCPACRDQPLAWERLIRVGEYRGALKQAVRETKFRAFRARGVEIGRLLGANVAAAMAGAGIGAHETLIVPVPMHWATRVWRGVDHTLAIARGVERETGARVWRCLRRRWGPDQVGVPRSRRWANIKDAFRACGRAPRRVSVRALVVVDDVKTTGSTLKATIRALKAGRSGENVLLLEGVRIWAGVVAVAGGGAARTRLGSGA
ncbi:MAG: ComF family protein [Phycisphaeraceae bacterium]|nr:MAG: ComF family protein [Phycisphaeraceae bacterium]